MMLEEEQNDSGPAVLEISSDTEISLLQKSLPTDLHFTPDSSNCSIMDSPTITDNFSLYAEEEDASGFGQDIKVKVDNPQKHMESFETYLSYRITVTARRPEFSDNEYVVRRRYNDFLWLRNKLVESHQTYLVPPLPGKHTLLGHLDRYSREFIKFRIIMLNRFLNRIIKHPILSYSDHLKVFLTANFTEFQAYQKTGIALFNKVSESICNLSLVCSTREKCLEFEEIKKYITAFADKLSTLEKVMYRIVKERKDLSHEMQQLGIEFDKWSSCETVLSPILTSVGHAISVSGVNQNELLVKPLDSILFQPIKEYLLYTDSVKELLTRRDMIQAQYEISVEEVEKKKFEKDQISSGKFENKFLLWKNPTDIKEEKLESLAHITPKLISIAEVNQDKLEVANENLRSDLERWSAEKKHDIKCILLTLSNHYIQYYQKSLSTWEEALKKINEPPNTNTG